MSKHHAALNQRRWRQVRRQVLDKASWTCSEGPHYGNEVDHRVPLRQGGFGPYDIENLQVLCQEHHIAKTRIENQKVLSPEQQAWRAFLIQS